VFLFFFFFFFFGGDTCRSKAGVFPIALLILLQPFFFLVLSVRFFFYPLQQRNALSPCCNIPFCLLLFLFSTRTGCVSLFSPHDLWTRLRNERSCVFIRTVIILLSSSPHRSYGVFLPQPLPPRSLAGTPEPPSCTLDYVFLR